MRKAIMTLVVVLAATAQSVFGQTVRISVGQAPFTSQLIERLSEAYAKDNPGFHVELVKDGDSDGTVAIGSEADAATVGRALILPFANSNSPLLKEKKVQRGVNGKIARQIFVSRDYLETLDAEDDGEKALPGTVYALTGSKATVTRLFAKSLNVEPSAINGKKILGREESGVSAVRAHDDAVSFNVANLLYNLGNRQQLGGLTVLAVDLDGNGRVSDEEREAVGSIDRLIDFVGNAPKSAVPVGYVSIESQNKQVEQFVGWIVSDGQRYLKEMGYLPTQSWLTAQK